MKPQIIGISIGVVALIIIVSSIVTYSNNNYAEFAGMSAYYNDTLNELEIIITFGNADGNDVRAAGNFELCVYPQYSSSCTVYETFSFSKNNAVPYQNNFGVKTLTYYFYVDTNLRSGDYIVEVQNLKLDDGSYGWDVLDASFYVYR
jgi:hypothetical protein